jgi:hypothetical protein
MSPSPYSRWRRGRFGMMVLGGSILPQTVSRSPGQRRVSAPRNNSDHQDHLCSGRRRVCPRWRRRSGYHRQPRTRSAMRRCSAGAAI